MTHSYEELQSLQSSTDSKLQSLYQNATASNSDMTVYSTLLWVILATVVLYYIFFKL